MLNGKLEIMLQSSDQGAHLSPEAAMKNNREKTRVLFQDQELQKNKSSGVVFHQEEGFAYVYAKLQFAPWTLVLEIPNDDSFKKK